MVWDIPLHCVYIYITVIGLIKKTVWPIAGEVEVRWDLQRV